MWSGDHRWFVDETYVKVGGATDSTSAVIIAALAFMQIFAVATMKSPQALRNDTKCAVKGVDSARLIAGKTV
jgi:hypothetical protein